MQPNVRASINLSELCATSEGQGETVTCRFTVSHIQCWSLMIGSFERQYSSGFVQARHKAMGLRRDLILQTLCKADIKPRSYGKILFHRLCASQGKAKELRKYLIPKTLCKPDIVQARIKPRGYGKTLFFRLCKPDIKPRSYGKTLFHRLCASQSKAKELRKDLIPKTLCKPACRLLMLFANC